MTEGQLGEGDISRTGGHQFFFSSPHCETAVLPLGGQGWDAQMSLNSLLWLLSPSQGKGRERKPLLSHGLTLTSVPVTVTAFHRQMLRRTGVFSLCALAIGVLPGQGKGLNPSGIPTERGREQFLESTGRWNAMEWRGKEPTKSTQWYSASIWYSPLFPPLSW